MNVRTMPPRTTSQLVSFLAHEAGNLAAAAEGARTADEAAHAMAGWRLCRSMCVRVWDRADKEGIMR